MKVFSAIAIGGILALSACAPQTAKEAPEVATAALPTEAEITANFDAWKAALATKDPKVVTALFSPDAVLEPTVSNQIRDTPEEVEAYFVDFLKKSPTPTINERYVRILDENTAIDAGLWTFALTTDGKTSDVTARYSFVWEKKDDAWKIQLLHSSVLPEPIVAAPAPAKTK